MSIRYRDVIERMERSGDYHSAMEYRDALREHHHSEDERVDHWNPADGAQHTHHGDMAENAYESIRRDERRREEEQQEREHYEQMERQRYAEQQQEQEPEPECPEQLS